MADWKKIKTEYITTNTSYRKLAQKHGVHYNAIANRAKQEDWISQREQYCDRTVTKTVTAISDKQVDRATKLDDAADMLLDKVMEFMAMSDSMLVNTQAMKHLSGVLKDIKEIKGFKSDADMREQEARIAKLRREAEADVVKDTKVIVQFEEDISEWSK